MRQTNCKTESSRKAPRSGVALTFRLNVKSLFLSDLIEEVLEVRRVSLSFAGLHNAKKRHRSQ